jgi:Fur family ferric uptake transcriptional regulator
MKNINLMLKNAGLRQTKQRISILNVLSKANNPLSQDEINKKIENTTPDKVTVYRCLEKFVKSGLVHHAYVKDRVSYYELSDRCSEIQCHPHFTCTICGSTVCMENASVPLAKGITKGFKVQRQQVRLEGLCPDCS